MQKGFGLLVISHCEDISLVSNGVMNEGETATRMGLAGIPNAAETIMVARGCFAVPINGCATPHCPCEHKGIR